MEAVNGTGWSSVLERLDETMADVVCVEEHRTPAGLIPERSEQLRKRGWKSLWAAATMDPDADADDLRNASGGVLIAVRKYIGLNPVAKDALPSWYPGG